MNRCARRPRIDRVGCVDGVPLRNLATGVGQGKALDASQMPQRGRPPACIPTARVPTKSTSFVTAWEGLERCNRLPRRPAPARRRESSRGRRASRMRASSRGSGRVSPGGTNGLLFVQLWKADLGVSRQRNREQIHALRISQSQLQQDTLTRSMATLDDLLCLYRGDTGGLDGSSQRRAVFDLLCQGSMRACTGRICHFVQLIGHTNGFGHGRRLSRSVAFCHNAQIGL